jgi:hypothetical protein
LLVKYKGLSPDPPFMFSASACLGAEWGKLHDHVKWHQGGLRIKDVAPSAFARQRSSLSRSTIRPLRSTAQAGTRRRGNDVRPHKVRVQRRTPADR